MNTYTVGLRLTAENIDELMARIYNWGVDTDPTEGVLTITHVPDIVEVPDDLQPPPTTIPPAIPTSEPPLAPDESLEVEPLLAVFTATPDAPRINDLVQFDAADSTGTITRYDWDFGDNKGEAQDGGPTPVYAYDKKGTRIVTLLVTDENGETDETELSIKIT